MLHQREKCSTETKWTPPPVQTFAGEISKSNTKHHDPMLNLMIYMPFSETIPIPASLNREYNNQD